MTRKKDLHDPHCNRLRLPESADTMCNMYAAVVASLRTSCKYCSSLHAIHSDCLRQGFSMC
jgi:hypothetical protein